jgi:hypothetical protein
VPSDWFPCAVDWGDWVLSRRSVTNLAAGWTLAQHLQHIEHPFDPANGGA